jgi:hypothetical protein
VLKTFWVVLAVYASSLVEAIVLHSLPNVSICDHAAPRMHHFVAASNIVLFFKFFGTGKMPQ